MQVEAGGGGASCVIPGTTSCNPPLLPTSQRDTSQCEVGSRSAAGGGV